MGGFVCDVVKYDIVVSVNGVIVGSAAEFMVLCTGTVCEDGCREPELSIHRARGIETEGV